MKKTILTAILIGITTLVASAQVKVTGVVLDENNQPMPGAARRLPKRIRSRRFSIRSSSEM